MQSYLLKIIKNILLISLFFLLVALSLWQWQRGLLKEKQLSQFEKIQQTPAVLLENLIPNLEKSLYRKVNLNGSFDTSKTLFWDNQILNHQVGYGVLMPFKLTSGPTIWTYRGWVKADVNRALLPTLTWPAPQNNLTLTGTLWKPQKMRFHFGNEASESQGWPKRIQVITETLPKLANPTLPGFIWLDQDDAKPQNLVFHPLTLVTQKPQTHYGYAVQWAMMALVFGFLCWGKLSRSFFGGVRHI